jgi:nucleotide-binding universal stress UspA family protein
MQRRPKAKLLVPVDGSDRSMNTVRYIARIDPFRYMRVVLFHVFSKVPEGYWDLGVAPVSRSRISEAHAWEIQQKRNINQYMEIAQQHLVKSGFPAKFIEIKTQNRKKGFARDIIREAQNGYYAIITRRRGMTGLRGIVLGSVTAKLLEKLTFLPIILAGRKAPGSKILLAFDGSQGSWHAVDFVGRTMARFNFKVKLIHAMRAKENGQPQNQRLYSPAGWAQTARKEMTTELAAAAKQLVALGFKPHQISTQLVSGVASRAAAIVAAAKEQDFGTIVMGRRGHSRVRDFFIGRVTNKVIHLGRDRTVWIIR